VLFLGHLPPNPPPEEAFERAFRLLTLRPISQLPFLPPLGSSPFCHTRSVSSRRRQRDRLRLRLTVDQGSLDARILITSRRSTPTRIRPFTKGAWLPPRVAVRSRNSRARQTGPRMKAQAKNALGARLAEPDTCVKSALCFFPPSLHSPPA